MGLDLAGHSRAASLLIQYIRSTTPPVKMTSSPKPGWVGDRFLLTSGESFGPTRLLYSGGFNEPRHAAAGNWKDQVGKYCSSNSRFLLTASAAFAGPVLEPVHMVEGGGLHFRGDAATGKSTALEIAASVFGNPDDVKRDWDGTKGSFEAVAEGTNDQLLVLDEIGMADERTVGDVVYLLANGASKGRMKEQRPEVANIVPEQRGDQFGRANGESESEADAWARNQAARCSDRSGRRKDISRRENGSR
jgi:putative DNA primase/helicase